MGLIDSTELQTQIELLEKKFANFVQRPGASEGAVGEKEDTSPSELIKLKKSFDLRIRK